MNTYLLLNIQWQECALYDAGIRQILIPWSHSEVPQSGHQISLYPDYFDHYDSHECFTYEGQSHTIYQWIEELHGWRIRDVKWIKHQGQHIASLVVVDDID